MGKINPCALYDAIVTNEENPLDGVTGGWRCQCMTPEGTENLRYHVMRLSKTD